MRGFSSKSKPSRVVLTCILLENFIKFLVDPYYEPLSWFMIQKYNTYNVSIEIMISFNQLIYHVDENSETVELIVTLSNPSSADITVQVVSNDITATSKFILC